MAGPHPSPPPRFGGATVLVVEDHEDSRDAMRLILESHGIRVLLAADGEEALQTLAREQPDLVFCDLRMPRLDGFAFMDRLRGDPKLARVRVIAVSGLGDRETARRAWKAGFDAHLVKPLDHDAITAALARVLWAHDAAPASPGRGAAGRSAKARPER